MPTHFSVASVGRRAFPSAGLRSRPPYGAKERRQRIAGRIFIIGQGREVRRSFERWPFQADDVKPYRERVGIQGGRLTGGRRDVPCMAELIDDPEPEHAPSWDRSDPMLDDPVQRSVERQQHFRSGVRHLCRHVGVLWIEADLDSGGFGQGGPRSRSAP